MEFSSAPDFVIKRKRKRSHTYVDPALGYYLYLPSAGSFQREQGVQAGPSSAEGHSARPLAAAAASTSPTTRQHEQSVQVYIPTTQIPTEQALAQRAISADVVSRQEKNQRTVEDFLQWSARPHKRQKTRHSEDAVFDRALHGNTTAAGAKTSTRRPRAREDSDGEYVPSSSEGSGSGRSGTGPNRAKAVLSKKPEAFSTRLLRAAVLSRVELGNSNDVVPTNGRRPLKFERVTRTSLLDGPPKSKVIPRKIEAVRPTRPRPPSAPASAAVHLDSALPSRPKNVKPSPAHFKPISYWQPYPLSFNVAPAKPKPAPKKTIASMKERLIILPTPPLKMVVGREALLEIMRPRSDRTQLRRKPSQRVIRKPPQPPTRTEDVRSKTKTPTPVPMREVSPPSSSFPLDVVDFDSDPILSWSQLDGLSSSPAPTDAPSATQASFRSRKSQPTGNMDDWHSTSLAPDKDPISESRDCARGKHGSRSTADVTEDLDSITSSFREDPARSSAARMPPRSASAPLVDKPKPLRPLTSYFDSFIETARAVARENDGARVSATNPKSNRRRSHPL
ncbi:hypothetical protein NM688_g3989 [Phlebia brevispora]|uniref:Uncharacterized protein n=1 Tax=Phlebia brevispora TaxID=194682 RepID=A0ACC1T4K0_9APHY|nr:hypothetical protein NM688_g3989 [Phlebia brevispora]